MSQASDVLFCISSEKLFEDCSAGDSLFNAARADDATIGQDERRPILLLNVSPPELDILYNYLYDIG